jgi:hypothetical protein
MLSTEPAERDPTGASMTGAVPMPHLPLARRLLVAVTATSLLALCLRLRTPHVGWDLAWVLVLLVSFASTGAALERLLRLPRGGLGLRLVWGLCAQLAVMSWLELLAVAGPRVLTALVVAGIWAGVAAPQARVSRPSWTRVTVAVVVAVVALATLVLSAHMAWYSEWDDWQGYLGLPVKLLARGSVVEPFGFRRMSAFGGQTYLHALLLLAVDLGKTNILDMGLAPLVAVIVLATLPGERRALDAVAGGLAGLVVLGMPFSRYNTSSTMTGVALVLGLYATMRYLDEVEPRAWARAFLLALATVGLASLKGQYVPVAALGAGLYVLGRRHPGGWRATAAELARTGLVALVLLLPFGLTAYRSNGTPYLLLAHGNYNTASSIFRGQPSLAEFWRRLVATLREPDGWVLKTLPVYWLAALLAARERSARAILLACAAGYLMIAYGVVEAGPEYVVRYAAAFVFPTAGLGLVLLPGALQGRRWLAAVLAVCAGVQLWAEAPELRDRVTQALAARANPVGAPIISTDYYRDMQARVPAGRRMLAMLNQYVLFDHARNDIWTADQPGLVCAPPGCPTEATPEAWEDYLRSLGIEYLAFVRPERGNGFYAAGEKSMLPAWRPSAIWVQERFEDWSRVFAALAARHRVLFDDGANVVVSLVEPH